MSAALAHAPADGASSSGPPAADTARAVGGKRRTPYLLLLPGALWLGVFFVAPMVFLASQSLQTGSLAEGYRLTWNVGQYLDVLGRFHVQLLRSLAYAAAATVLALLVAYPLAYTIAFRSGRWKNVLLVLVVAPFFTSFLIRTLAWQNILATDGPVTSFLQTIGVTDVLRAVGLIDGDQLLGTHLAVVCGLTYNFLPFMTLPLYASLERIDPRLLEAAGDLYASPFTGFRKVTLPLSVPGVVAGTLLTFIPAAGDYVNSTLLGSPGTTTIGQVVQGQFLRVLDYPAAAALSVVLMVTIVVLVTLYVRRAGTEELL